MKQLKMYWTNDGAKSKGFTLPEGVSVKNFTEVANAEQAWLSIVRHMAQGEPQAAPDLYQKSMLELPLYDEKFCFFLLVEGQPAATITVVCDREKEDGLIHMVACDPTFRGRGLGHLLCDVAVHTLKQEGMKRARLTTDDWRLAAIKTYLRAGFEPDRESEPDYRQRWADIEEKFQK